MCRGIVTRERIRLMPRVPQNIDELERALPGHWATRENFRGRVNGPNGSSALIFISNEMLQRLNDAQDLLMDGTFRVTPRAPRFSQLFMIFMRDLNHVGLTFTFSSLRSFSGSVSLFFSS